jgi:aspartate kinase
MRVFKFGGASVKDADGIRNLHGIIAREVPDKLIMVVSAMGKTTNALEEVLHLRSKGRNFTEKLDSILHFHLSVVDELFERIPQELTVAIETQKKEVQRHLNEKAYDEYALYDTVVSLGELLSTLIIEAYLSQQGIHSLWMDARQLIETDNKHREGAVQWKQTEEKCKRIDEALKVHQCIVTQGFIAASNEGHTTTLGREGSDYSAAILAHVLQAEQLTIWKDVAGVFNADPKYFDDVVKLDYVSFEEAIELAYYGASIIHPRTIQPLQDKDIELCVKSFKNPNDTGTRIGSKKVKRVDYPLYIVQTGQYLITIATRDYAFIVEDHLKHIFSVFARHQVKIDIMQNSAIHFSVAVHNANGRLGALLEELSKSYEVKTNQNIELLTILHYNNFIMDKLLAGKQILMEQRTRQTYRALYI